MMFWGFAARSWAKAEAQCEVFAKHASTKVTDAISQHWADINDAALERTESSTAASVIEGCLAEVLCAHATDYDLDDADMTLSKVSSVFAGTAAPMLLALRCGILFSESQRAPLAGYTIAADEMETVVAIKAVALMRLLQMTSIEI